MVDTHIEFYDQHKISPVRLDIPNLDLHLENRAGLFRHLSILSGLITGKRILEFGSGSGFNSIHLASLEPESLTLVDGNPTGIEQTKDLYAKLPDYKKFTKIEHSMFDDYKNEEKFDLVIMENVLVGQPGIDKTLKHVTSFVAPGGLFVTSCMNSVGLMPETLRRLLAFIMVEQDSPLEEKVRRLLPIFSSHLASIDGMNRRQDDWIIDNLLNPMLYPGRKLFSFPETIETIGKDFDFLSSSPRFMLDWRWYKTLRETKDQNNNLALEQYWMNVHNFLDLNTLLPTRPVEKNKKLFQVCREFVDLLYQFEATGKRDLISSLIEILDRFIIEVQSFSSSTAEGMKEARELLSQDPIDKDALTRSKKFGKLFGRANHHFSFIRK
jgi:2-polyprenyl-3-methyl-5-hydroxy-6-metoxy-1,4-benzoquinol methylase